MIGLILVTAPNAFADSLFINTLCAHAVFDRSTDPIYQPLHLGRIWHKVNF